MLLAIILAAVAADPAGACASPGQPAQVLSLDPANASSDGAPLLVSATVILQAAKADEGRSRAAAQPCALGGFRAAGADWTLTGADQGFVRRALAPGRGQAAAFVYPVADLTASLAAAKGQGPPPPTRYLLVTAKGSVDTLWRAYADPPSDDQLRADLTEALEGRASPVADVDLKTHKVNVYVGGKH